MQGLKPIAVAVGLCVAVDKDIFRFFIVNIRVAGNVVLQFAVVGLVPVEVILDAVGDVVDSGLRVVEVAALDVWLCAVSSRATCNRVERTDLEHITIHEEPSKA